MSGDNCDRCGRHPVDCECPPLFDDPRPTAASHAHCTEAVEKMARLLWKHDTPNEDSFQGARWAYHYGTYHKQACAVLDALVPPGFEKRTAANEKRAALGIQSTRILNGTADLGGKRG